MNVDLRQDDLTIHIEGSVTPPPEIGDILARVATAATYKQELTLTPGEARILNIYLADKEN